MDALTRFAETGEDNLPALSIEAARARAVLGEISHAREKVWGGSHLCFVLLPLD